MKLLLFFFAFVLLISPITLEEPIQCSLCQLIITGIEFGVEYEGWNETQILSGLKSVCESFPKWKVECDTVIVLLGEDVIQYIANFTDPVTVCEIYQLCPTSLNEKIKLVDNIKYEKLAFKKTEN